MTRTMAPRRIAQTAAVLLCAAAAKLHYSAAGADELRWVLAPTAAAVGAVSGARFEFESHAGYVNGDRSFVIAAPCAGVNFLITAFLMLTLRRLWWSRPREMAWGFIPCAAAASYLTTLAANTVRISAALSTRGLPPEVGWLSQGGLHRLEGVVIYFGFLLLLYAAAERVCAGGVQGSGQACGPSPRPLFPLVVYYATTLGVPMLNGAHRRGADFWAHSLFVLLAPLALALPLASLHLFRARRGGRRPESPGGVT